jgi:hypothetical protein
MDYDVACHLKEQRDFQRYHNTPLEVNGMWFASLAEFEQWFNVKEMERVRCKKLTIDLMSLVRQMTIDSTIKKMVASSDEFPPLKKTV